MRRACRHLGVRLIDATLPMVLMPSRPGALLDSTWDAMLLRWCDLSAILYHPAHVRTKRFVFSVAHELGHFVLDHPPGCLNGSECPEWAERQANEFARHLLLPCHEMREYRRRGYTPSQIAHAKGVSVAAVEVRLARMGAAV